LPRQTNDSINSNNNNNSSNNHFTAAAEKKKKKITGGIKATCENWRKRKLLKKA